MSEQSPLHHPEPQQPEPQQPEPQQPGTPVSTPATQRPAERLHPLTPFVKGWIGVLAIAFFVGRSWLENGGQLDNWSDTPVWLWIAVGSLALSVVIGIISWLATRFRLDDDALRLQTRAIWNSDTVINYSKIQSIDLVTPLAARVVGVTGLRIDVGSGQPQKLEYLNKVRANEIRDELSRRAALPQATSAAGLPAHPPQTSSSFGATESPLPVDSPAPIDSPLPVGSGQAPAPAQAPDPAQAPTPGQYSAALPAGAMVSSAIHPPTAVIARATPAQLVGAAVLSDEFLLALVLTLVGALPSMITGRLIFAGFVVPFVGALVSVIGSRVIKEWNYRLELAGTGVVRVGRGLTDVVTQTVPVARVQGFQLEQPWLWRRFGWWRVKFSVLGYAGDDASEGASTVLLPVGSWTNALAAMQAIWPQLDLAALQWQSAPRRARWLHPISWRQRGWAISDPEAVGEQVLTGRTGRFSRQISMVALRRLQSWRVAQGPLQRRCDLATLSGHISGSAVGLSVSGIDRADARGWLEQCSERVRAANNDPATTRVNAAIGDQRTDTAPRAAPSSH